MAEEVVRLYDILMNITNIIYPVGSIYISTNSTNPGDLFGGNWTQIEDTFLLAAGATYSAGSTGGEANHTLTVDQMPTHTHKILQANDTTGTAGVWVNNVSTTDSLPVDWSSPNVIQNTGGGKAFNNMPPYLTVYMWKRTG